MSKANDFAPCSKQQYPFPKAPPKRNLLRRVRKPPERRHRNQNAKVVLKRSIQLVLKASRKCSREASQERVVLVLNERFEPVQMSRLVLPAGAHTMRHQHALNAENDPELLVVVPIGNPGLALVVSDPLESLSCLGSRAGATLRLWHLDCRDLTDKALCRGVRWCGTVTSHAGVSVHLGINWPCVLDRHTRVVGRGQGTVVSHRWVMRSPHQRALLAGRRGRTMRGLAMLGHCQSRKRRNLAALGRGTSHLLA
ncbi:hypothetical protein QBC34DRAFT_391424 [Podospora aff. communis PSN243]|uniref:Uncharacterized protein n=1 Tax=Podospora aff. communis PSN243 TaxID=3040156 RepID=A0AAV9H5Q6_9PEZI|nr:hypothetical protein QBC34DRAFT_391424 [Podospora aff. communis PSN243]